MYISLGFNMTYISINYFVDWVLLLTFSMANPFLLEYL